MGRDPLVFRRPVPAKAVAVPELSHGDILYRLALIAPAKYRALETLAREEYRLSWPLEEDVIAVLSRS